MIDSENDKKNRELISKFNEFNKLISKSDSKQLTNYLLNLKQYFGKKE